MNIHSQPRQKIFFTTRQTPNHHISGSNTLLVATIAALVIANIPSINQFYFDFWKKEIQLNIGGFNLLSYTGQPMTLLSFINDALMTVFFPDFVIAYPKILRQRV